MDYDQHVIDAKIKPILPSGPRVNGPPIPSQRPYIIETMHSYTLLM